MRLGDVERWSANPMNAKLFQFLVEKTKDALSPISMTKLAAEFKERFHPPNSFDGLGRIKTLRQNIYHLQSTDMETKVKLLFALSVPVDEELTRSKIKGEFRFDDKKRIIYYKSIDGNLKLEGDHNPRKKEGVPEMFQSAGKLIKEFFANRGKPNNVNLSKQSKREHELWKFIDFVFDKCKNISSPLILAQFYDEYNALYSLTRNHSALHTRIKVYCREIQNVKSLDTPTKVKQLFGLNASLTDECLEELRQNALIRLDKKKRIIEYSSHDGSLHLQGKHDHGEDSEEEQNSDEDSDVCVVSDDEVYLDSSEDDKDSDEEETGNTSEKSAQVQDKMKRLSRRRSDSNKQMWKTKMHPEDLERWSAKPINDKLIQFLIEKTKDALSPIGIRKLAAEFKERFHPSKSFNGVVGRIKIFRQNIYHLQRINMETRVKLLFALSVPVHEKLLGSKIKGEFRFDDEKRIIYYESIDGKLKLEGNHDPRRKVGAYETSQKTQVLIEEFFANREKPINLQLPKESEQKNEFWKFINFVFEKCKNISSPLVLLQMYDEYNALYRLTKSHSGLYKRIKVYCQEIQNVKSLDTPTKVRQLFGLSASLTEDCLEELRQNALVRVDELKRITEYQSNDGSLLLRGRHDLSSKSISKRRPLKRPTDSDGEDSEEERNSYEDSDVCVVSDDEVYLDSSEDDKDLDEEETGDTFEKSAHVQDKMKRLSRRRISSSDDSDSNNHQTTSTAIQTSRCGRLSKNKDLDEHLSHDEVKESVLPEKAQATKTASVSDANTPRRTNNKRKIIDNTADSSKRSKESTTSRTNDLGGYDPNHSFNYSNSMANDREHVVVNDREEARLDGEQVKVEVFRGALQDEVITIGDEDDDDIQEIPPPPKRVNEVPPTDDVEIKQPVVPMTQKPEEPVQVKEEVMTEEEDVKPTLSSNRTPILQILQGLHTLIVLLYHPSFEPLQKELEERIKRFEEGSGTSIPIAQIVWTMELCFSKMTESSVRISFEGPQFINLRDFLCYLKSFILNLKIEELKSVMDKINECMKNCQNKRIRVKKVEEILRVTLDNITI
ncbi:unnamed protein product [Caenorhabditis brenneri]